MRIVIVGAGIAGLSSAWALAKAGHAVTLVEQGSLPNPRAASGDHHRIIRRAYGAATGYGAAITEAYEAWEELWADLGARHIDPRGFMAVSREEGDEAEDYRDGLDAGGWAYDLHEPEEAVRRWPFLQAGSFRYAYFSREGGALHCRAIARDMAAWLASRGVTLLTDTLVTDVDTAAGRVRFAGGGAVEADFVIVTAGAWVGKLFPFVNGTLTAYRTAVVYLEPPADLASAWAEAPVVLDVGGETDGYIIPPSGGGGLKFGSGLHKFASHDADAFRDAQPGEGEVVRDLFGPPLARLDEYRVAETVTCAYIFTADERFAAFQEGKCLIVSACSGHGYKFGAAVGRRVADYVADGDFAALMKWLRAE